MKRFAPIALIPSFFLSALLLLLTLFPAGLTAQDNWKLLDVNLDSGFDSEFEWPRPGAYMFWRTDQVGYYRTYMETGTNDLRNYKTTDGGQTWTLESRPDPVPHKLLTADSGYSMNGYVTANRGNAWRKLYINYDKEKDSLFFPDSTLRYTVVQTVAASPKNIVAFYQLHNFQASVNDSVPYGPFRLAYTNDGGTTWSFFDYMTVFGDVLQKLDSTVLGPLPAPENMTAISNGWAELLHMPNDSVVYLMTRAYGFIDGNLENHYYLGKINVRSRAVRWVLLPFYENVVPPPAAPLEVNFISDRVAYAIQAEFVDINNPDDVNYTLWRSEDAGETWESTAAPPWVDYRSLRFTSETHGVASNAFTNDGGRTWTEWAHMFGRNALVYAYDSTHYFLANRFSLFASSTDAGRTWSHNESGGIPLSVLAHGGKVFVGRSYQSLMVSADSGETWRDLGADGELPERLSTIVALGFPDILFNPNRVVGIATFIEYNGAFSVKVIESNDGGNVWSVGESLPDLADAVGPVRMSFVRDPESETDAPTGFLATSEGLFVSTNGGISWARRNSTHQFEFVSMMDPQFGAAILPGGIYTTSDGGATWTQKQARSATDSFALGLRLFGAPDRYRSLFSDKNARYRSWSYKISQDAGLTWSEQNGTNAAEAMDIEAFWGDSSHVHAVGRGATIQLSQDGGQTFTLEHAPEPSFKILGGLIAAGQDNDYIYMITPANQAGRYRLHKQIPVSVPVTPGGPVAGLFLTPNPTRGGATLLDLELTERADVSVRIYDLLGSQVTALDLGTREAGHHRQAIDVANLPNGHYRIEVSTPNGLLHAPMVIVR